MKPDLRDPKTLHPHPVLKSIPAPGADSPLVCACADAIRENGGFVSPILIDESNQILTDDSRLRWIAAQRMALAAVPVTVQAGELAPAIALGALLNRDHLTQGARAYITVPLLKPAFEAARAFRLKNLRNAEDSSITHSVGYAQNLDELAAKYRISKETLRQARLVRAEFERDHERYPFTIEGGPQDGREVLLTLREFYEPKILREPIGGEHESYRPVGLGGVLAGIGSIRKTKRGEKRNATQLLLFERGLKDFGKRFRYWSDLDDAQRRQLRPKLQEWAQNMPDDLFEELQKARRASRKEDA
jgi:hypothetical protein